MAELVAHLERHGYVERMPDPGDRRAKLVRATPRGSEVYAIAREFVAELEAEWAGRIGKLKMRRLRELLEELTRRSEPIGQTGRTPGSPRRIERAMGRVRT